jgi:hypothetical protein
MVELLDLEYETDRAAATAIFNGVVDLLAQRKSLAVGVLTSPQDDMSLAYGPFWDAGSARRFAALASSDGLLAFAVNLYRPVAPLEPEPPGWCPLCGHTLAAHAATGKTGKGRRVCFHRACQPCAPSWPKGRRRA